MEVTKDMLVVVLLATATGLCLTIIAGAVMLLPGVRRSLVNLEKVTSDAVEMGPHVVKAAVNVKDTTAHLLSVAKDVSQATPLLRLLGPAGATVNMAQQGIGRLAGFIRSLFRR